MAGPFSAVGPIGAGRREEERLAREQLMGEPYRDPGTGPWRSLQNVAGWLTGMVPLRIDRPFPPINVEGMPSYLRERYEQMVGQDPRNKALLALSNPELTAHMSPEQFDAYLLRGVAPGPQMMQLSPGTEIISVEPGKEPVQVYRAAPPAYTLGPGQARYGGAGQLLAHQPFQPPTPKLLETGGAAGPGYAWSTPGAASATPISGVVRPKKAPQVSINLGKEEAEKRGSTKATLAMTASALDLINRIPPGAHGLRGNIARVVGGAGRQWATKDVADVLRNWAAGGEVSDEQLTALSDFQQMLLIGNREILVGDRSRLTDQDQAIAARSMRMDMWATPESASQAMMTVALLRIKNDEEIRKEMENIEPEFPVDTVADQKTTADRLVALGFSQDVALQMVNVLLGMMNVADVDLSSMIATEVK